MDLNPTFATEGTFTPDNLLANGTPQAETATVKSGQNVTRATVMGQCTKDTVGAAVATGGNTGNGTVSGITLGAKAQVGTYTLRCSGAASTPAASGTGAAVAGNTGDGTITAAPATGAGAKVGVYRITCIEPATDAGKFSVEDPDGVEIGIATVAVAFTTHLTFTIADGATDFAAGDAFTVTVAGIAAGTGGAFLVFDPSGARLGKEAAVGVAFTSPQINFTVNDGATNFVPGDEFTVAVSGSGKWVKSLAAAVDGSQDAAGILAHDTDASAGDKLGPIYTGGPAEINQRALVFGAGHSAATVKETLRARGLFLVSSVKA